MMVIPGCLCDASIFPDGCCPPRWTFYIYSYYSLLLPQKASMQHCEAAFCSDGIYFTNVKVLRLFLFVCSLCNVISCKFIPSLYQVIFFYNLQVVNILIWFMLLSENNVVCIETWSLIWLICPHEEEEFGNENGEVGGGMEVVVTPWKS